MGSVMASTHRNEQQLARLVEAILFAAAEPMTERELAQRLPDGTDVRTLLQCVSESYSGRGVQLVKAGSSWAFATAPDLAPLLVRERTVEKKLSRAAIETLAIIAYHQPVTRGDVEEIRGVQLSKGTLDVLFDNGWITPKGRRETPGRPVTWATTEAFLRHFGLAALSDLPNVEELRAAGLLDARPAIQSLRDAAGVSDATPTALPEPLDPDAT
ncbi:MAG: SMC-Scp complex subunit ScpB [Rhodospirillales bacterium]|nr:SMC-Scp complex subunit ScpB [Rhodospirillales bacterium]